MMKLSKNESGFTLIEILIVVLIIGIIAALAVPNLLSAQKTAWANTCLANRSTILSSAELYRIKNSGSEADDLADLTGGTDPVLRSTPKCPAGGTYTLGNNTVTCNSTKHDQLTL